METDAELLDRYRRVKAKHDKVLHGIGKMKVGARGRPRRVMWAGSLQFLLLSIQSEIEERGLKV